MAVTPTLKAPQSTVMTVFRSVTPSMRAAQGTVMVPYNVPAKAINATVADVMIPYRQVAQSIRSTQGLVLAVVKGQVDNPKLRSWTFTLDDHDFWVLKLGTYFKTLVYDLQTKNWSWWSSASGVNWRASTGFNWRSAGAIPFDKGTNVLVGDDSTGVLWILDPLYGVDDNPVDSTTIPFPRVATGQITADGREFQPIYSVTLDCVSGYPQLFPDSVTLKYSDDNGQTYITADQPQVSVPASFNQDFQWLSMGRFRSPGRLFQISDMGGLARIDCLDINTGNTKGS